MLRLPLQNFGLETCIAFQNCRLSRRQCITSTLQDTMNNRKRRTDKQRSKETAEPSGPDQTKTGTRHQARSCKQCRRIQTEIGRHVWRLQSLRLQPRPHVGHLQGRPAERPHKSRWNLLHPEVHASSSGLRACLARARRALHNPLSSWGGAPGRRPVSSAWAAARAGAGFMPRRSPARGPPAARRSPAAHSATGRRAHTCRRRRRPPAAGRPRCAG